MTPRQSPGSNRPKLSLHVPEPPYRPGDEVDYSWLEIPEPDEIPRPDETSDAASIRDLAYGMIRVLNDEHQAVGSWNPNLDPETLLAMLRKMALLRAFDDRIAAVWCGEGSTSEGDFHNALTFGAVYNAPCIFNVVNCPPSAPMAQI
jgi:hypothetical protein